MGLVLRRGKRSLHPQIVEGKASRAGSNHRLEARVFGAGDNFVLQSFR